MSEVAPCDDTNNVDSAPAIAHFARKDKIKFFKKHGRMTTIVENDEGDPGEGPDWKEVSRKTSQLSRVHHERRDSNSSVDFTELLERLEIVEKEQNKSLYERKKNPFRTRKHKKPRHSNRKSFIDPHSDIIGDEFISPDLLKRLSDACGYDLSNNSLISRFENLALLSVGILNATSPEVVICMIGLYFKTEYHGSIGQNAFSAIRSMFTEPQSSSPRPDWLGELKKCLSNWRQLLSSPMRAQIQKFLSILVSVGVCEACDLTWTVGKLVLFQPSVEKLQLNAFDFTEAVLDTFIYWVDVGWQCFDERSLSPLLYGDSEIRAFDHEYTFLVTSVEHIKTGNLEKVTNIDENEFACRLSDCLQKCEDLLSVSSTPYEERIYKDRYMQLMRTKNVMETTRCEGGFRIAPYTSLFWGASEVAKSSISLIDMTVGLLSLGFRADSRSLCTQSDRDQYDSNFRAYTNGIFLDDMGNTKEKYVTRAPSEIMIEIANNVQQYAVKADVDEKGKVDKRPKMVNATSNFQHGGALDTSNCPISIARRFHCQVEVKIRPELRKDKEPGLDRDKLRVKYTVDGVCTLPTIPDMWLLTVRVAVSSPSIRVGGEAVVSTRVLEFEGKPLVDVDVFTYLRWKVSDLRKHMVNQKDLEGAVSGMDKKLQMCPHCKAPVVACQCVERQKIEPHSLGWIAGVALHQTISQVKSSFSKVEQNVDDMVTLNLLKYAQHVEAGFWFGLSTLIPSQWYASSLGRLMTNFCARRVTSLAMSRYYYSSLALCLSPLLLPGARCRKSVWIGCGALAACRMTIASHYVHARVTDEIVQRRDALPLVVKQARDSLVPVAMRVGGAVFIAYTAVQIWKGFRSAQRQPQGNLQPLTVEEVVQRDAEVNPWKDFFVTPVERTPIQLSSTYDRVIPCIQKGLKHVAFTGPSGKRRCNMQMLCSNVGLIPIHIWMKDSEMEIEVISSNGHRVFTRLDRQMSYDVPETDFSLVYCPALGSQPDITKFLPLDKAIDGQCGGVWRDKDGQTVFFNGHATRGEVGHALTSFYGGSTLLSVLTCKGMCIAPLIAKAKGVQIIGFHLGGETDTPRGVYGTLTQEQVKKGMASLSSIEGVICAHSDSILRTKVFGVEFFLSDKPHEKSPVRYIGTGSDTNYKAYGECIGRASFHTNVYQSPMSLDVEAIFGVPNLWGPPKAWPSWRPWHECLLYASAPSRSLPAKLLISAIRDYKSPLLSLLSSKSFVRNDVRPLTRMQVVCGVDGKRFIDRMKMNTSMGFPIGGAKSKFLLDLDPDDYVDFEAPADFPNEIWHEADLLEQDYRNGVRGKPVFKACLKDEITSKEKEKVRVFQCAPVALQLLLRKFFLPVARVLSLFPLISECAVGVNAVGPEWEQLNVHMEKFGVNRILAGDYSKYDLRMPPQLTLAAFRVMIDLAVASKNYSDDDVLIMQGLAFDCCYPMVAFDGTLLEFIGTNPSGQNLTVYINSIVNSLLLRCCFLELYPNYIFRDGVAVMTYGDDVKGSVSMWKYKFNHLSYAAFLERFDMKFTMPDKKSVPTTYMCSADADFLKRKNVYCPEVKARFGALDENSIIKGLHNHMRSKFLTTEQSQAEAINMAAQEWFYHGEDVYNLRMKQLDELAKRHNLVVPSVHKSYNERLCEYKTKYLSEQK